MDEPYYGTVSLRRPSRWYTRIGVLALPVQHWELEHIYQRAEDNWRAFVSSQATALYYHTHSDSKFEVQLPPVIHEHYTFYSDEWAGPKRLLIRFFVHIENIFKRWCEEHGARTNEDGRPIKNYVKRPRWLKIELKSDRKTRREGGPKTSVEYIEDALIAQIDLLQRHGLSPRAVLCSPEVAYEIRAAPFTSHHDYVRAMDDGRFYGLQLIVCDELRKGAVVV